MGVQVKRKFQRAWPVESVQAAKLFFSAPRGFLSKGVNSSRMSQSRRIAILGGTGLLGSAVVEAISERRDLFDLTLITRGISTGKSPSNVRTVVVDALDDASERSTLVQALQGQDILMSTLNSAVAVKCK